MEFVLIALIMRTNLQGGITDVTQTFTTFERCEAARAQIVKATDDRFGVKLVTAGCYKR